MLLFLSRLAPASDDLPSAAAAGTAAATISDTVITDLDALIRGLIAAAVVKLMQVALSSAIEGMRASINGKGNGGGKA